MQPESSKLSGGQPGNKNAAKGKMFYDQMRKVLVQEPERLRTIAENLIREAEAGEPWAIKEIMDRLDGKAVQATTVANEDGTPLTGLAVTFVNPT
jgi:hypothetical protein